MDSNINQGTSNICSSDYSPKIFPAPIPESGSISMYSRIKECLPGGWLVVENYLVEKGRERKSATYKVRTGAAN